MFYNFIDDFVILAFIVYVIYYIIIFSKDSKKRLDQNEKIIKLLEQIREENKSK